MQKIILDENDLAVLGDLPDKFLYEIGETVKVKLPWMEFKAKIHDRWYDDNCEYNPIYWYKVYPIEPETGKEKYNVSEREIVGRV